MRRRLAAILAADVVGYSRLMGQNEAATLASLSRLRKDHIEPLIAAHHGRVVKLMGDGILAEFASVVDAVACAVDWQSAPQHDGLRFRIGVNLGDVIVEDDDIYGNGVNVAARLEGLAEPGGITLSAIVHGEVKSKLPLTFEDLGEQSVKNIADPVRVYRVVLTGAASPAADPAPPVATGKPTVAVLPFDNMSGDHEFFVDGITEDIITALSRTRWFNVTARNSTFAYKGKFPDVREAATALGANYVLEGSVRRGGNRARITVQLIEATTGNHVWADRYDRNADDDFAVQDEIAQRVSSILTERIWQDVARNIGQKPPQQYGPYDYAYRAIELIHHLDPRDSGAIEGYLSKALEADADLLPGHLGRGFWHAISWLLWGDSTGAALDHALRHALKLQEIAPDDAQTYRLLSRVYTGKGMYDDAWRSVERAFAINPNDGDIIANRGVYHTFQGASADAHPWFDKVLELHADTPHTVDIIRFWKAVASFNAHDYKAAFASLHAIAGLEYAKNLLLAACHSSLGEADLAAASAAVVTNIHPPFRLSNLGLCRGFQQATDRQHMFDALHNAGLPDD